MALANPRKIDLVLVDRPLELRLGNPTPDHLPPGISALPGLSRSNTLEFFVILRRLLVNFPHQDVLELMINRRKQPLFHWLLTVSEWQFVIDQHERRLRALGRETLGKETLNKLGELRRALADSREVIAENERQMLLATGIATLRNVGAIVS